MSDEAKYLKAINTTLTVWWLCWCVDVIVWWF